jgi:predicted ATP-binding protein involved in virulence
MGLLTLKPGDGVWVDRLKIENFRAIANLELEFRYRLTLLIGENGAGKTTVLDALAAVLQDTKPVGRHPSVEDLRKIGGKAAGNARVESSQNRIPIRFSIGSDSVTPHGDTAGGASTLKAYFGADRSYENSYRDLLAWFTEKDTEELRQIRELRNPEYRDEELAEVRRVVEKMIPGTANLRIDPSARLVVDQTIGGRSETFDVAVLAGGLRTMLVLVADLARMTVSASAGAVTPIRVLALIDEVDLHLHPRWQLDIMRNLLDAFPTVQFIVTTHSEEIISSVQSECVIKLESQHGQVVAGPIPRVQGATFDRVLEDAMGLPGNRPPEVQQQLDEYWKLVDAGAGEAPEALARRNDLDKLFRGSEPELVRADLVIRRKRARAGTGT